MFLTPEQTGGPGIWALRQHTRYLAVARGLDNRIREFDIEQLAEALGQDVGAGRTWRGHRQVILLACCDGRLFEWLDKIGGTT